MCCDLELIGYRDGIDNSGYSLLCVVTCVVSRFFCMESLFGGFSEDLACLKNYEVFCEEVGHVLGIDFSLNLFLELEEEFFRACAC